MRRVDAKALRCPLTLRNLRVDAISLLHQSALLQRVSAIGVSLCLIRLLLPELEIPLIIAELSQCQTHLGINRQQSLGSRLLIDLATAQLIERHPLGGVILCRSIDLRQIAEGREVQRWDAKLNH